MLTNVLSKLYLFVKSFSTYVWSIEEDGEPCYYKSNFFSKKILQSNVSEFGRVKYIEHYPGCNDNADYICLNSVRSGFWKTSKLYNIYSLLQANNNSKPPVLICELNGRSKPIVTGENSKEIISKIISYENIKFIYYLVVTVCCLLSSKTVLNIVYYNDLIKQRSLFSYYIDYMVINKQVPQVEKSRLSEWLKKPIIGNRRIQSHLNYIYYMYEKNIYGQIVKPCLIDSKSCLNDKSMAAIVSSLRESEYLSLSEKKEVASLMVDKIYFALELEHEKIFDKNYILSGLSKQECCQTISKEALLRIYIDYLESKMSDIIYLKDSNVKEHKVEIDDEYSRYNNKIDDIVKYIQGESKKQLSLYLTFRQHLYDSFINNKDVNTKSLQGISSLYDESKLQGYRETSFLKSHKKINDLKLDSAIKNKIYNSPLFAKILEVSKSFPFGLSSSIQASSGETKFLIDATYEILNSVLESNSLTYRTIYIDTLRDLKASINTFREYVQNNEANLYLDVLPTKSLHRIEISFNGEKNLFLNQPKLELSLPLYVNDDRFEAVITTCARDNKCGHQYYHGPWTGLLLRQSFNRLKSGSFCFKSEPGFCARINNSFVDKFESNLVKIGTLIQEI